MAARSRWVVRRTEALTGVLRGVLPGVGMSSRASPPPSPPRGRVSNHRPAAPESPREESSPENRLRQCRAPVPGSRPENRSAASAAPPVACPRAVWWAWERPVRPGTMGRGRRARAAAVRSPALSSRAPGARHPPLVLLSSGPKGVRSSIRPACASNCHNRDVAGTGGVHRDIFTGPPQALRGVTDTRPTSLLVTLFSNSHCRR